MNISIPLLPEAKQYYKIFYSPPVLSISAEEFVSVRVCECVRVRVCVFVSPSPVFY